MNVCLSGNKTSSAGNRIQIKNILSPDRIIFLNHSTKHDALLELAKIKTRLRK